MTATKKMKAGDTAGIREKLLNQIRKACEEAETEIEELLSSGKDRK